MTAPRTTAELVAGVIEVDSSIPLAPFMLGATLLVTDYCTGVRGPLIPYDSERLQLIETWLAAHLYAIRDNRAASEHVGPISTSFQYKVDLGLDVTMYGQTAKMFDSNGGLAALDINTKKGRRRPTIAWLGTDKE